MRKLRYIAVAGALAALAVSSAPASAQASTIRECGDMRSLGIENITTRTMSCCDARRAVRSWAHGYAPNMFLSTHMVRRHGRTVQDYRYTRNGSVLRFQVYDPC